MYKKFLYATKVALVNLCITVVCVAAPAATSDWQQAEQKGRNAVVQVLAQYAEFNWLEPYKSPQQKEGSGSAFFINKEGYLLTNFHVVNQAKSVQLCIPALGRKLVDATIVGVCPDSDVALLKASDEGLAAVKKTLGKIPFLELGDSDALYPTEPVLALGYPLGQRYLKSTVGVIAGREYLNGSSFMHITAPINPGNSGGPLLTMSGKVVGINSAGVPGAQNVGYIIPINDVKILLKNLYTNQLLRKPSLGIWYNQTTEEHAKSLKNPLPAGVYINDVTKNSVADKAGIKAGDMLYAINGYEVDQYGDVTVGWRSSGKVTLDEFLIRLPLGESLKLDLYRNGKRKVVNCTFDLCELLPVRFIYPDYEQEAVDYEMIGGLCLMQLRQNHFGQLPNTPGVQVYTNYKQHDKEVVVVTRVLPGSCLHKISCFYEGAVLDKINNIEIKNLVDVRKALQESVHTGLIQLSHKDKVTTMVSLDTILQDEERIARDFMFSITDTVKKLKEQRKLPVTKK